MSVRLLLRRANPAEIRELERRERRHRQRLREAGCTGRVVVDDSGCFAAVLVERQSDGRLGFLDPDGEVRWLDEARGIGALAPAVAGSVRLERRGPERRRRRPVRRG